MCTRLTDYWEMSVTVHCPSFLPIFHSSKNISQSRPFKKVDVAVVSDTCDEQCTSRSDRYVAIWQQLGSLQSDSVINCVTEWWSSTLLLSWAPALKLWAIAMLWNGPPGLHMILYNDRQTLMSHPDAYNPGFTLEIGYPYPGCSVFLHPSRQMLVCCPTILHYLFLPLLQFSVHQWPYHSALSRHRYWQHRKSANFVKYNWQARPRHSVVDEALCYQTEGGEFETQRRSKSYPRSRYWSPIGLWDVKDPTLSRQSVHRWR
jgi:hypothetical protein